MSINAMPLRCFVIRLLQSLLLLLFVSTTAAVPRDHDPTEQQEQQQWRRQQQQQQQEQELEDADTAATNTPKLIFDGSLYNDVGSPVSNASVQFWHADVHGNYLHPGDTLDGHELQTDSFAYFGTATTDTNGNFRFRTYRPGLYASRPITHIHFKVFYGDQELLTSQFYFSDEQASRWFDESLVLTLEDTVDDEGSVVHQTTSHSIFVDMGLGGTEKLTPPQQEGPFYPIVDFFNASSDMTVPNALLCNCSTSSELGAASIDATSTNSPSSTASTTTTARISKMLGLVSVLHVVSMALP